MSRVESTVSHTESLQVRVGKSHYLRVTSLSHMNKSRIGVIGNMWEAVRTQEEKRNGRYTARSVTSCVHITSTDQSISFVKACGNSVDVDLFIIACV